MDGRVSSDIGQLVVSDEDSRCSSPNHARDPGITKCTMPTRSDNGSHACPKRQGPQDNRTGRERDVYRNGGSELHDSKNLRVDRHLLMVGVINGRAGRVVSH